MSILIRRATQNDFGRLASFLKHLYLELEDPSAKGTDEKSLELNCVSPEPKFHCYVAVNPDGEVVGSYSVSYRRTGPHRGRIVDVASVFVDPDFRKKSIGKALLKAAIKDLVAEGFTGMFFLRGVSNIASQVLHAPLHPETFTAPFNGLLLRQIDFPNTKLALTNKSPSIETSYAHQENYDEVMKLLRLIDMKSNTDHFTGISLDDTELWKSDLNNHEYLHIIVAKNQNSNRIVGCATFVISYCMHYRNVLILDRIVVEPNHRRRGIGKNLINACFQEAAKIVPVDIIRTVVPAENVGVISFFERIGAVDKSIWVWCKVSEQQMKDFAY